MKRLTTPHSPHQGNDPFRKISLAGQRRKLLITYWDVWFLLVLQADFDGDWGALTGQLRGERQGAGLFSRRETAEALLSHLRVLQRTLTEAALTPEAVLGPAGPTLLKTERRRARQHLWERTPRPEEKSEWMWRTPRRQLTARAHRGYWSHFPVSPEPYAEALARVYKRSGWYSEDESFGLERELSGFLEQQTAAADPAEALAVERAFLTVVLEKMDQVDDSYGVIGGLYGEAFGDYIQTDLAGVGLTPEIFYQDWLELALWEDYAFTHDQIPECFAKLTPDQAGLVETILRRLEAELREAELDYQAEKALTLCGVLCAQQRQFDRFVELARQMGTRDWQRIQAMSAMAEKHRRHPLALEVYEACFAPGLHEGYLRRAYAELQARVKKAQRRRPGKTARKSSPRAR